MTECHKCKTSLAIAALLKKRKRLAAICAECCHRQQTKKETPNNHGQSFTSLNWGEDAENITQQRIDGRQQTMPYDYEEQPSQPANLTAVPEEARDYLVQVMSRFSVLTYDEGGLVCCMMRGMTIQQIADQRKEKKQTVLFRWNGLIKRHPEFKAIATGQIGMRVGCGCGRKPKVAAKFTQQELFAGGKA